MAHKKFDEWTAFLGLDFIFMFWVFNFRNGHKDGDSDDALFQSNGKALSISRMAFA